MLRLGAMGVVIALWGCLPGSRPEDLSDWDACVVRAAALDVSDSDPPAALVVDGSAQVLSLHARWGGGGLIAVEHFWGSLLVALPAQLEEGQVLAIRAATPTEAQYREGHSITSYQSDRVLGHVTVLDVSDGRLALSVSLEAADPVIDLEGTGPRVLRGRIVADREDHRRDCH